MKISIINQHCDDTLGGSELQCDFIARELTKRGYNVQYIAIGGTDKDYDTPYPVEPCKVDAASIIEKLRDFQP
ncbi:MAG: hypothetical protein R3220_08635, partial [Balneolaceae bacterium]|nr:hypothetical protein [Balneolaceae bacterium]